MGKQPRIRTPLIQHWRRIRYQLLPVLIFCAAAGLTAWLWGRQVTLPNAVGEVAVIKADVVCPVDGLMIAKSDRALDMFDIVQAGEVVARLDDGVLAASLATLQADLVKIAKELDAAKATVTLENAVRAHDQATEVRRLALDMETLRLGIVDRKAAIEVGKIELARLKEKFDAIKALFDRGVESRLTLVDTELRRDVVQQQIESNARSLAEAEVQLQAAAVRAKAYTTTEPADLAAMLAPLRAAITAQEALIREMELQIQSLEVKAPMTGMVTAVYCRPGQNVRRGTPILTIASTRGDYIVSYVRQEQRVQLRIGMEVDVRVRSLPRAIARARIERVGAQVEMVPQHQQRDPKMPEWGLPVQISLPKGLNLRPGELVDLAYVAAPTGVAE